MAHSIRSRRLAAVLALLVPFPLAAACGGDDSDVVLARDRDRDGKGGKSAGGAAGNGQAGTGAVAGSAGLGGAAAGSSTGGSSTAGSSAGGSTTGGSAGTSNGGSSAGGASAGNTSGGSAGSVQAGGSAGNAGSGGSTPAAVCGNGKVEAGEDCDDGNILPGDGCFQCKVDFCGNGKLDGAEVCDGSVPDGKTCANASGNDKLNGKLACSTTCTWDYKDCFESCVSQSQEATLKKKPVDVIFVIDNSGSMANEIKAVQDNINKSFADIIGNSGLDYRVIMISAHGASSNYRICVSSPLSGTTCSPIPAQPALTDKFKQYSVTIGSKDSLSRALATYAAQDGFKLAPGGWSQWLRSAAAKVFVEITDDNQSGLSAAQFDASLLALPGGQFGTAAKRNYVFHSIIGVAAKAVATAAYEPNEPIVGGKCNTAVNTGSVYQDLSKLTGGLRFPVCASTGYDAVFKRIADGIVEGTAIECEFAIPPNPSIDRTTLQVEYTPGGGGAKQVFDLAKTQAACAADRVYIEGDTVHLCPAACTTVQGDPGAKLGVLWGCGSSKD